MKLGSRGSHGSLGSNKQHDNNASSCGAVAAKTAIKQRWPCQQRVTWASGEAVAALGTLGALGVMIGIRAAGTVAAAVRAAKQ